MEDPDCIQPKAADIAYVRFRVPDLDRMSTFFEDFGLRSEPGTFNGSIPCVYGCPAGGSPFACIAEEGPCGFIGVGFRMDSQESLVALSKKDGASEIQTMDAPGGGTRVRFIDPNGFEVDGVFAQDTAPTPPGEPRPPINTADNPARTLEPVRLQAGPVRVRRLGHCVLNVIDFRASETWYKNRFGLLTSEEILVPEGDASLGAFMRCDRGDIPVDHHTLFLIGSGTPGFNHVAYEVDDWDSVMLGHDFLAQQNYEPHWGIGKHILGSQIFDYWKDPFGNVFEHFSDGDLFNADKPAVTEPFETLLNVQWGPTAPLLRG